MKRWDNLGTVIELTVTVADAVGVPGVRMGHDLCRLAYRLANGDPQEQRIATLESQQCASLGARTLYAANQNAWDWPQGPNLGADWQPDAQLLQAPSAREIFIPKGKILASALSILPVGFHPGILSPVILLEYLMEEDNGQLYDDADPERISVLFKNAGGRYCVGFTNQRTLQRLGVTLLPQWQDNGRHLPPAQQINATTCQQWELAPSVAKTKKTAPASKKQTPVIAPGVNKKEPLSDEEVEAMLERRNFYDRDWNPTGKAKQDWQPYQDEKGQTIALLDRNTGLLWEQGGSSGSLPFSKAQTHIDALNEKRLADQNTWRLPTLEEAASLLVPEKGKKNGLHIYDGFDKTQRWIWTSDHKAGSGGVWVVGFDNGSVRWIGTNYFVRGCCAVGQ